MMTQGFACYQFTFGWLEIGYQNNYIICLKKLAKPLPLDAKTTLSNLAFEQVKQYLAGQRQKFTFPYQLQGSAFQKKVWRQLQQIPYGQYCSYKDIAVRIGHPRSYRAVGNANHRNPLLLVVPCHRVIGANGKLLGFAGGQAMQQALLNLESRVRTQYSSGAN